MKIGIFGGAFNPVHNDHLTLAQLVYTNFKLDKILFIPNANPPHKDTTKLDFSIRVKILELALENIKFAQVSYIEQDSSTPHYTFETLQQLTKLYPAKTQFYLIMGADSLLTLDTWYRGLELIKFSNLIVVDRVGFSYQCANKKIENFIQTYKRQYEAVGQTQTHGLYFLYSQLTDISSTVLRQLLKKRDSNAAQYLPPQVYQYIVDSQLYLD